jgi:aminopeptidase N
VDRTPGANPIRQNLDNLNEAGSLYGAIIYQKAPVIMRHLEALLGEGSFPGRAARVSRGAQIWQRDLDRFDRDPRSPHADGSARVEPGVVEQPGRPTITTELTVHRRPHHPPCLQAARPLEPWSDLPQQLRVVLGNASAGALLVPLEGEMAEASDAVGMPAPALCCRTVRGGAMETSSSTRHHSPICRRRCRSSRIL